MNLFPKIQIEISSSKSAQEVIDILKDNIRKSTDKYGEWDKLLEGEIKGSVINISKTPILPFCGEGKIPVLRGKVINSATGSRLVGVVTYKKILIGILSFFYVITLLLFLSVFFSGRTDLLLYIIFIVILVFVLALSSHLTFYREFIKLKELLNKLIS